MRIRVWRALARGVVLESIRRKDLWVVAILGVLILASASALGFFGTQGLESFIKDLAAAVLGLFSALIAVLTASRMMPEEIKCRTLYPLLSRPISRFDLIVGKLIGAVVVTWLGFLILVTITGAALFTFGVRFEPIMLQYVLCKMLGLMVVCSVSLTLSMLMTQSAAATTSLIIVFGSGMIVRGLVMAYETSTGAFQMLFRVIHALLPQYGLFDLGARAANQNWGMVPSWVVSTLTLYALVYSAAMVTLCWAKFRKQGV